MSSLLELLFKKPLFVGILALIAGLSLGLLWGWVIQPVTYTNTTPALMRSDLQEDYLRMAIDSFRVNPDPNLAVQRWKNLGPAAALAYSDIQQNPGTLDPAVIRAYGEVIQTVLGSTPTKPAASGGSPVGIIILIVALVVLLVVVVAAGIFLRRLLGKRSSGEVTPTMQMTEINREAEKSKTDFQSLGVAQPITQNMTTYVMGDDLYDESFSIDTQSGDFLGEYGVGVSEIIGVGDPKRSLHWRFGSSIKTISKPQLRF